MKEIFGVVPTEVAYEVREAFLSADYDTVMQERKTYYQRDFNVVSSTLPENNEVYLSNFKRSGFLENSNLIKDCVNSYIIPAIEKEVSKKIVHKELRCYYMNEGGHFRIHKDDYISDWGFVWYLNSNWKWDWGGLLLSVHEDQTASVSLPQFNKLVVMNHGSKQLPHCVTPVNSFAKEPRIMLVGFLKTE
jgi:Rps23 Pro-64 3,4-dihydroxylase Tpa1-like proline 4-hydroxylase